MADRERCGVAWSGRDRTHATTTILPGDADTVAGPPVVAGSLLEEQVMPTGSLRPVGQRGRIMGIVRKDDRVGPQVRFDRGEFLGLVVVGVQAVVEENVHVPAW